jgi:flagellar motor switch protein FliN
MNESLAPDVQPPPLSAADMMVGPELQAAPNMPLSGPFSDHMFGQTPFEAPQPLAQTGPAAFLNIPITLELVLATIRMPVSQVMALSPGVEIGLHQPLDAEVSLRANGTLIAYGTLQLIDAETRRFGVRITRLADAGKTADI